MTDLKAVHYNYVYNGLPIEGLWCDENCMKNYLDFELDFDDETGNLTYYVDMLHG